MATKQQLDHPPPHYDGSALPAKRSRPNTSQSELSGSGEFARVELNPADCDLDFDIEGNGLQGHGLHGEGFAYCWSGARANFGITGGKYCFGCKIVSEQAVDMADTPPDQQHLCRVGISRGTDPVGGLGETAQSFGFGGTGKFSTSGKFINFGTNFGVGDTIVCAVNLDDKPVASIGFSKNGTWLGIAKHFEDKQLASPVHNSPWDAAFFPHILLKNVVVQLQFSIEDGLIPEVGYKPWSSALEDEKAVPGPTFATADECEVMMLVGLPAAGKTTWAEKWVKDHPEKRYVLLGTNLALDQMKVPGLLRKHNYGERFERLMDQATEIFNALLARAGKLPRNYIIDQTNVYRSARIRKLKAFANYRKIAVVVFPTPDKLKFRAEGRFREMGKEVPAEAVNEMLANYILPTCKDMPGSKEPFDEVIYTELNREDAQKCLDGMKRGLGTSDMNVKQGMSPYSREGSMQSLACHSVINREADSGFSPHLLAYRPTVSLGDEDFRPIQVTPIYSGSHGWRASAVNPSTPNNTTYRTYLKFGGEHSRRDEPSPYRSYTDSSPKFSDPCERHLISSHPNLIGGFVNYHGRDNYCSHDPYTSYGSSDIYAPYPRSYQQGQGARYAHQRPEFNTPSCSSTFSPGYSIAPQPSYNGPAPYNVTLRNQAAEFRAPSGPPHQPKESNYGLLYAAARRPAGDHLPPYLPPSSW